VFHTRISSWIITKIEFSKLMFEKSSKYQISSNISLVGEELFHADGQTDR